jgi:hypothetical protein
LTKNIDFFDYMPYCQKNYACKLTEEKMGTDFKTLYRFLGVLATTGLLSVGGLGAMDSGDKDPLAPLSAPTLLRGAAENNTFASSSASQASASESPSSAFSSMSSAVPLSDGREATIGDLLGLSQRTVLRIVWNTEKKESTSVHTGLGPMPLYPRREEAQKRHQKFGSNPLGTVHFGPGIDGVERIKDSTSESGSGVQPCEEDAGISSSMRLSDFYAPASSKSQRRINPI